mmetsp:Transcript_16938/g.54217  ORF Transcript_16938/g.54217 Transcript_16938/m.54217 type:complete len:214 (+) Transcript_16938:204-845(+)
MEEPRVGRASVHVERAAAQQQRRDRSRVFFGVVRRGRRVEVEQDVGAERERAHVWRVHDPVRMRREPCARLVLIHEAVIGRAADGIHGPKAQAHDRVHQGGDPRRQRFAHKRLARLAAPVGGAAARTPAGPAFSRRRGDVGEQRVLVRCRDEVAHHGDGRHRSRRERRRQWWHAGECWAWERRRRRRVSASPGLLGFGAPNERECVRHILELW